MNEEITKALKLAPDADSKVIVEAIMALQKENEELKKKQAELDAEVADQIMSRYAHVVTDSNRKAIRDGLIHNRTATLAVLSGCGVQAAQVKTASRVLSRRDGRTPEGGLLAGGDQRPAHEIPAWQLWG